MISQGYKKRYCGYCRQYIGGLMEDFMKHLDYCELVIANKASDERHKKKEGGEAPSGT